MDPETHKLLDVIYITLAIIAYTLIISHYLPESAVWKKTAKTLRALKFRLEGHGMAMAYSIRHEIPPIVAVSLLLNVIGWGISTQNPNILYLDMAGTAATSFLLGPWWGAVVGILTNIINAKVYPPDANVVLVPWMLVNLTGGIFWGLMARTIRFRVYVKATHSHILAQTMSHLWFLFWFGVVGALVMAVAGAMVSWALGDRAIMFAQDPVFGQEVQYVFNELANHIRSSSLVGGSEKVSSILIGLLRWMVTTFRYVPDKTICAAVGLFTAKYMFPLFSKNLITDTNSQRPKGDNWLTPAIAIVCYAAVFPWSAIHDLRQSWIWYLPFIMLLAACIYELFHAPDSKLLLDNRAKRARSYIAANSHLAREEVFGAIVVAVLISSLVFMSGLFFVPRLKNKGTIAFSFLRTILTYFLAFYLIRLSMRQWAATLSSGHLFHETRLIVEPKVDQAEPILDSKQLTSSGVSNPRDED